MQENETQINALRQIYADKPALRPFFDELTTYLYNRRSIKIDVLHKRIGGKRVAVVAAFKALAELGLGTYVKGSWGHASRFDFVGTTPKRVGLLARGVDDEEELPDIVAEVEAEEEEETLEEDSGSLDISLLSIEDMINEIKRRGAKDVTVHF